MSEAEFDVEAAENEFNAARAAREAGEPAPGAEDDAGDKGDERADPPTYMTHDEWIEAGRDPEDYIGKKAFQARHDDIQESKRLRRDMKGMKQTAKQTMEAVQEWQTTERAKIKAQAEADLHKAKENEDPNAALAAQKKLDDLDAEKPAAQREEHPVIEDFREDNPKTDRDSEEYDEEFTADVEAVYNSMAQQLTQGGKRKMTDGQIKRCLKKALKEANELHEIDDTPAPDDDKGKDDDDDAGESARNKRSTGQQRSTRRSRSNVDTTPRAEDYDLKDRVSHNPRDGNAAAEIRDTIRKSAEDNARKGGKDDAAIKKAGDTAAKNFERSIA